MSDDIYINIDDEQPKPVDVVQVEFDKQDVYIEVQQDYAPVLAVNGKVGYVTLNPKDFGFDSSNVVYITGDQTISGNKNFNGNINLTGQLNRIGYGQYIYLDQEYIYFKGQEGTVFLSTEEFILNDYSGVPSIGWHARALTNQNGDIVLYWTGNNIDFLKRPLVNNTGVLLIGEAYPSNNPSGFITSIQNIVYTTGNQSISGNKTFLSGIFAPNLVYTTGAQTISGSKIFRYDTNQSFRVNNKNNSSTEGYININEYNAQLGYASNSIVPDSYGITVNGPLFLNNDLISNNSDLYSRILYINSIFDQEDSSSSIEMHSGSIILKPNAAGAIGYVSIEPPFDSPFIELRVKGNVYANNLVYNTGNQTISGVKTFELRPTVNGTGVLLSGEASSITLPDTIVYTTGDQAISGNKTFNDAILFKKGDMTIGHITGSYNGDDVNSLEFRVNPANGNEGYINIKYLNNGLKIGEDGVSLINNAGGSTYITSNINSLLIEHPSVYINSSDTNFNSRPKVNNSGVVLIGELPIIGSVQHIENSNNIVLDMSTYDTFRVTVTEPTTFTYENFKEGQSINIYLVAAHNGHVQHTFPTDTTFAELGDANTIYSFENYTTRILLQKIGEEVINFSSINITPDSLINFPAFHVMTVDSTINDILAEVAEAEDSYYLYPPFDPSITDYYVYTSQTGNSEIPAWSIYVNENKQSNESNNIQVLKANDLVKVTDGTNSYFIRFTPDDVYTITPTTTPTENYKDGYYLAGFYGVGSDYYYIFDKNGVPVWYFKNDTDPLSLHIGNNKNKIVTNPWANQTRSILNIKNTYITGVDYNPVDDSNENTVSGPFMWDNHEAQELSGPLSRKGNFIGGGYVNDGFYLQEQSPSGTLVWDWYSIEAFSDTDYERYHLNSIDVHPINGDIICSLRHTSSIVCIDYQTKNVKWVLQGSNPFGVFGDTGNAQPLYNFAQGTRTENTQWISGSNIIGEPEYDGNPYNGTCAQHDARYHTGILPISGANNVIISIFDDQTNNFPYSRGVIYEIDEENGVAYHRFSIFSDHENSPSQPQSQFMGSYTVLKETDNSYSHIMTLVGSNNSVIEYNGETIPNNDYNTANKVLAFDTSSDGNLTSNIYRFIKVPTGHFNINNLRNTAGLPVNTKLTRTYQNLTIDII